MQDWVEVPLSRGMVAKIDRQDMLIVGRFSWHAKATSNGVWYAQRGSRTSDRKSYGELMHRRIMEPGPGMQVDHINGDGLDNRRANLRVCTILQNNVNKHVRPQGVASPFIGVRADRTGRGWNANTKVSKRTIYLGYFKTAEDAARTYDVAVDALYGEFATTNFPVTDADRARLSGVAERVRSVRDDVLAAIGGAS